MEKRIITQKEISEATGIPQSYVSGALHGIRPIPGHLGLKYYEAGEALEAIVAYCERRRQAVAEAMARKIGKWDRRIDAARGMAEESAPTRQNSQLPARNSTQVQKDDTA